MEKNGILDYLLKAGIALGCILCFGMIVWWFVNSDQQELALAIEADDAERIEQVIALGADYNKRIPIQVYEHKHARFYPLTAASALGKTKAVKMLLRLGADPNQRGWSDNPRFSTALVSASFYGKNDVVILLLKAGADPNLGDRNGYTPLHSACFGGCAKTAEILIQNGADINAQTTDLDITPLHQAVICDRTKTVEILLEHGADWQATNEKGETPLDYAHRKLDPRGEITKLLESYERKGKDEQKLAGLDHPAPAGTQLPDSLLDLSGN